MFYAAGFIFHKLHGADLMPKTTLDEIKTHNARIIEVGRRTAMNHLAELVELKSPPPLPR